MIPNSEQNKYAVVLEKIDEMIATYVEDGCTKIISINGCQFAYATLEELMKLRHHYAALADLWDTSHGLKKTFYRIKHKLFL